MLRLLSYPILIFYLQEIKPPLRGRALLVLCFI